MGDTTTGCVVVFCFDLLVVLLKRGGGGGGVYNDDWFTSIASDGYK